MSTGTPEAARNHSRSKLANRAAPGVVAAARGTLALAGFAGALLVALTTFATVIEITVGGGGNATADFDPSLSGYDRHSVALLLIGAFAAVLHVGGLRGSRPAMLAVAGCGIAVLLIAVLGDAPDLDQTGQVAELYEDTSAQAGTGFYLETLGGALLAVAGVGLLVLGGGAARLGGRAGVRPEADRESAGASPRVAVGADPANAGAGTGVRGRPEADRGPDDRVGAGTPLAAGSPEVAAAPEPSGPAAPSPARRLGAGLAAGAARARQAREEQQARRAERAAAEREREAARAERARVAQAQAAEQARIAGEARAAEQAREAERREELQRDAEAAREAAGVRAAQEAREAEAARAAKDAREAEEARAAQEAREAEAARAATEARETEVARAADARQAEEAREAAAEPRRTEATPDAAPPAESPTPSGELSFDERLRQARERARRNRR